MRNWLNIMEGEGEHPADLFMAKWDEAARTLDRRVEVRLRKVHDYRVELEGIEVAAEARGRRLGSAAMEQITEIADEAGVTVVLFPEPSMLARLEPFYERFGFVSLDGGQSMSYEPNEAGADRSHDENFADADLEQVRALPFDCAGEVVQPVVGRRFAQTPSFREGSSGHAA